MPNKMFKHFLVIAKKSRRGAVRLYEVYDKSSRSEGILRVIRRPLYAPFTEEIATDLATLTAHSRLHPHLVPIVDAGLHKRRAYVFTQKIAGDSLQTRLEARFARKICFSLAEVVEWLDAIAPVLDTMHAKDVVHGALKPTNIFWVKGKEKEEIRICDVGMNRLLNKIMGRDDPDYRGHFNKAYGSPEQARGKPARDASDRYSLAVILFHALTAQLPFAHAEPPQPPITTPPTIRTLRPDLPPRITHFFQKALATQPDARFPTVVDMANELRKLIPAPQVPPRPIPQESLSTGTPALVAFIIVVAFVLIASFFHMM